MDEHIEAAEKDIASEKDRFLPASILIAAVMITGAIVFSVLYRPAAAPPGGGAGGAQGTAPAAQVMQIGSNEEVWGAKSAPVTIIEYGDYQCPYCTRFFTDTQPLIGKNYVDAGKVRMVFRNFAFLGPESNAAAAAADCAADQGKLWPYHDALYRAKMNDEAKGGGENDGSLNRALFLSLARQLKLDISTFTSCIDGNKYAGRVAEDRVAAAAAGVNSTPTFFVNGTQIMGAQSYGVFQQAIEAALKG